MNSSWTTSTIQNQKFSKYINLLEEKFSNVICATPEVNNIILLSQKANSKSIKTMVQNIEHMKKQEVQNYLVLPVCFLNEKQKVWVCVIQSYLKNNVSTCIIKEDDTYNEYIQTLVENNCYIPDEKSNIYFHHFKSNTETQAIDIIFCLVSYYIMNEKKFEDKKPYIPYLTQTAKEYGRKCLRTNDIWKI